MPRRMEPLENQRANFQHGSRQAADRAVAAKSGRATGAARLSRKNRLPRSEAGIASIANSFRSTLEQEMRDRFGMLGAYHWEVIDTCYWCDVASLRACRFLEHNDLIDPKTNDLRPIMETVLRMKKLKLSALQSLGLDKAKAGSQFDSLIFEIEQEREDNGE